jgi:hypothetical protein
MAVPAQEFYSAILVVTRNEMSIPIFKPIYHSLDGKTCEDTG